MHSSAPRPAPSTPPLPPSWLAAFRRVALALWLALAVTALYGYSFHRSGLALHLRHAFDHWGWAAVGLYLLLGCVRGFTLIPATYLVLAGIGFFAPTELWLLTLAGIAVSSASLYFFAELLGLGSYFEQRHPLQLARLRSALQRHELGVIIVWSFLPIAPTDVICYVCGALRLRFLRFLVGVLVGEGTVCALYIYGAHWLLRWL